MDLVCLNDMNMNRYNEILDTLHTTYPYANFTQSTILNLPLASLPAAHANTTDITEDNKSVRRWIGLRWISLQFFVINTVNCRNHILFCVCVVYMYVISN